MQCDDEHVLARTDSQKVTSEQGPCFQRERQFHESPCLPLRFLLAFQLRERRQIRLRQRQFAGWTHHLGAAPFPGDDPRSQTLLPLRQLNEAPLESPDIE